MPDRNLRNHFIDAEHGSFVLVSRGGGTEYSVNHFRGAAPNFGERLSVTIANCRGRA